MKAISVNSKSTQQYCSLLLPTVFEWRNNRFASLSFTIEMIKWRKEKKKIMTWGMLKHILLLYICIILVCLYSLCLSTETLPIVVYGYVSTWVGRYKHYWCHADQRSALYMTVSSSHQHHGFLSSVISWPLFFPWCIFVFAFFSTGINCL